MEQQVQAIIFQDNVEVIACNELLEELQQTLQKPKLKKYISLERAQKDAQASFLLTGDKDLLVLKLFENAQIIKLSDYVVLGS